MTQAHMSTRGSQTGFGSTRSFHPSRQAGPAYPFESHAAVDSLLISSSRSARWYPPPPRPCGVSSRRESRFSYLAALVLARRYTQVCYRQPVPAKRLRAGVHARRSINRNGEQSASVARQIKAGRELASRLRADVVKVYDEDDTSAFAKRLVTLPDGRRVRRNVRPRWQEILGDLYQGRIDLLIEYDLDRSMREPRDLEDLIEIIEQTGRAVESVTGSLRLRSDAEITMARIGVAVANKASRDTSRRVREATADRAAKGLNHGGKRCFGYSADGYSLVESEAAEVRNIFDHFLAGVPLGAIVRDLTSRRVPTVTGKPWIPSTVRGILSRARYAGIVVHRGEILADVTGQWPTIVEEATWRRAVRLLSDPARRTTTGNRAEALLSGIATCPICEGALMSRGGKPGQTYKLYRCRKGCVGRRRDWVDEYVARVIVERLSRPDAAGLLAGDQESPDRRALQIEAVAIRGRIEDAAALLADTGQPIAGIRDSIQKLTTRLHEIETQLELPGADPILTELVDAEDVRATWDGLGLNRQRAVVRKLAEVRLHPGGGGRHSTGDLDRDLLELVAPYVEITPKAQP
jgi:site-specific DNA recombinase